MRLVKLTPAHSTLINWCYYHESIGEERQQINFQLVLSFRICLQNPPGKLPWTKHHNKNLTSTKIHQFPTPVSQIHKYQVLGQCESTISWYKAELLTWVYSDSAKSARCVWKFTYVYPSVGFATYTRTHIVFFMQMYPIFHVLTRFIILWSTKMIYHWSIWLIDFRDFELC